MWTEGFQGRTVLLLDYNDRANVDGPVEEWLEDPIGNSLTQIADEASEATTDRYECDFAFDGDAIRLWFGLVTRAPPLEVDWSDILPELPPMPLTDFVTVRGS